MHNWSPSRRAAALFIAAIAGSSGAWLFAFYPIIGHDYSYWVPLLAEGKAAWVQSGRLIYDFSPVRCLGLPAFSHPNALQLSLFHFLGLVVEPVTAIYLGTLLVMIAAFVGFLQLGRALELEPRTSLLLALGWCLQGWSVARVLAGHLPFVELLLAPWLLYALLTSRHRLLAALAAAFWLTHMLYSGAFYAFVIVLLSCLLALVLLHSFGTGGQPPRRQLLRLAGILALVLLMALPKLIGTFDFLALFPRHESLVEASLWQTLLYSASQLLLPVPYSIHETVGWGYGDWEALQFLFPGLIPFLLFQLYRRQDRLEVGKALSWLAGLMLLGAVLSSGMLREVFAALPVLKSLHVNPRWHAVILLPAAALTALLLSRSDALREQGGKLVMGLFAVLFVAWPLLYLAPERMGISYRYGQGIVPEAGRVAYCYEPIFGYGLESFPARSGVDWVRSPLRDPRCYLASGDCAPGSAIEPDARVQLRNYTLDTTNVWVERTRLPALLLYGLGFIGAVIAFLNGVSTLFRRRRGARAGKP